MNKNLVLTLALLAAPITLTACQGSLPPSASDFSGTVVFPQDKDITVTIRNSRGDVVTPTGGKLPAGQYTATFSRPGYITSSPTTFQVSRGGTITLKSPELVRATGSLVLNKDAGITASLRDSGGALVPESSYGTLPVGEYTVVFSKPGYASTAPRPVVIETGKTTTITVRADELGMLTGTLVINKPDLVNATVRNSSGTEIDASQFVKLPTGDYTVVYTRTGYRTSDAQPFSIRGGETTTLTAPELIRTTGSLVITAPAEVTVTVKDSAGKAIAPADYAKLPTGQYTVTYSREGYVSATANVQIVAGETTTLTAPALTRVTITDTVPQYVRPDGKVLAITDFSPQRFHVTVWTENASDGVSPELVGSTNAGTATAAEQSITAQATSQVISGAYVTYRGDDQQWYPALGVELTWRITSQSGAVSILTGDNAVISGDALSAQTYTNYAGNVSSSYPVGGSVVNSTGVSQPQRTGYSWAAFSHDPLNTAAQARVQVTAQAGGNLVGQGWLGLTYASRAALTISRQSGAATAAKDAPVTTSVTVTNTGRGPASNIHIADILKSGDAAAYSIKLLSSAGEVTATSTGFHATFGLSAGQSATFVFEKRASAAGKYCDALSLNSYSDAFGPVTQPRTDEHCVTVTP